LCALVLSIFSIGGGGSIRGVVIRLLFSALIIMEEACMGLNECLQLGVGPRVMGRELLTAAYPDVLVGEACEESDKSAGGRVKCS
jgi:hypothetical protein